MNKIKDKLYDFTLSILISITLILASIKITLNFKQLYYMDINYLHIYENSYLSVDKLKIIYSYLINYLTLNSYTNFSIPYLPSSKEAIIHFKDVKIIFSYLNNIFLCCIFLYLPLVYCKYKKRDFKFIKLSSTILFISPLIFSIPLILNFDKCFTVFHKLLFSNNYWLFDPLKDPVINLLPQAFFLHCALFIVTLIELCSLILFFCYKKFK